MNPFYAGKVRDLYPVDEESMILYNSDRLSAFDVVFGYIPGKGKILSTISNLWFQDLNDMGINTHIIETDVDKFPEPYKGLEQFRNRSVLVKKCKRIDFECIVRGYIIGSGWKDYQKTGYISSHKLPEGLQLADELPEPIFTPSTKEETGHDMNVTINYMRLAIGDELTARLENISLAIYKYAYERLRKVGIILCDTKFEFGLDGDRIVLIDEVLTPDSSRYWDESKYVPGTNPVSYDKQFVRDYCESIGWDKKPPAPVLPIEVTSKTIELYNTIQNKIEECLCL